MTEILSFNLALVILALVIWLYCLPATMAHNRNRSGFFWFCVGLMFSPLLAIFLLWLLGPAPEWEETE